MNYTHLGRSGLKVSRLCLGTMNFGPHTTEADSHALMDHALELGIQFFDTANGYGGGKRGEGVTEQIIGRWLAQGGGRRERIVLATKVYAATGEGPNDGKLSAWHLRKACDDSLRRLKTDHIDLYQMHHVDRATPWEEIWQAMEQLVTAGKVIYVGSSNFAGWHIAQAQAAAASRHFMGLISEQCRYSLVARMVELDLVPACRGYGLGIIPWSPLGGGFFAGTKRSKDGRAANDKGGHQQMLKKHHAQVEAYENLCQELGESTTNVALAWLLHNPTVTAPIIGPRTMQHLKDSVRAPEIRLAKETLEQLDKIWPGPGGEAPEAFAW